MQPSPAAVTAWRYVSSVNVARGEDAGDVGRGVARRRLDIARRPRRDLAHEELGGRGMADGDEDAVGLHVPLLTRLHVLHADMGDTGRRLAAADLVDRAVPHDFDLGMGEEPLLEDALRAGSCRDGAPRSPWKRGWRDRAPPRPPCSPPPTTTTSLLRKKRAVAGGAGRDAEALEGLLGRQPEPLRLGAGGDDQRIAGVGGAAVAGQPERPSAELGLRDVVGDHRGADVLGLLLHLLHQPGTLDDVGEAGGSSPRPS